MRMKVICAVMAYNGETYHDGDYVKVENKEERGIMVQERCAVESPEVKTMENPSRTKGGRR